MTLLYDFPSRYTGRPQPAFGSIDEIAWISADASDTVLDVVPRSAALYVRGWAANLDLNGPAPVVVLRVDDVATYEARVGLPRPDVALTFENDAFSRCGFEAIVPTGRLAPGAHTLSVCTLDPATRNYARFGEDRTFTIVAERAPLPDRPFEDRPTAGAFDTIHNVTRGADIVVVHGCATVARGDLLDLRGWLCLSSPPQAFLDLYAVIDDRLAFAAAYGDLRADVAANLESPDADAVGFSVRVPTVDVESGEHALEFVGRVRGLDTVVRTSLALRLTIGDPLPARIPLDESTAALIDDVVRIDDGASAATAPLRVRRGDRIFVRGWAFDETAQSLAAGVVFVIDDQMERLALYGLDRPDIAETFGNPELARSGFSCEFETNAFATGVHTAKCRVLSRDGRGALRTSQMFTFEVFESP